MSLKRRHAVIMAGGSGTRFWPQSSSKNPKQFLKLVGPKSMIQLTRDRLKGVTPLGNVSVVCAPVFASPTRKHLGKVKLILEPEARNTMAAVCLSVWAVAAKDPDAVICVLPADAYVEKAKLYAECLNAAYEFAEKNDCIVCLGIKPRFPATGYGYIEVGPLLGQNAYKISHFYEKPTIDKAEKFFSSGRFLWNAGIFVFKASTFIEECKMHAPIFYEAFQKYAKKPSQLKKIYSQLPKLPVDVALMEKTSKGALCVGDFGWNDIGSWPALAEVLPSNSEAGLVIAAGGHATVDSHGVVAKLESKKFLGLVGVKDIILVETKDAILVCHKDKAQEIKALFDRLPKKFK